MKFIHLVLSLKSNLQFLVSAFRLSKAVTGMLTALVITPSPSLASDSETAIDKIKKFEKALFYLVQGDYLQAGKLFEEVAADAMFPNVIRNAAQHELTKMKNKRVNYNVSISTNPFQPKRKYKTNILYLDVYGAPLPFTVKIEEPEYEVFAINQELTYQSWFADNQLPFDQLSLSHSIASMNNKNIKNNIGVETHFFANPIGFSFSYKKEFEVEEKKTPFWSTDQIKLSHKSLSTQQQASIAYTQDLKTKQKGALRSDEEVVINLNTQLDAKRFNWSNSYSFHLFRNPENIYSEWNTGLTLPISGYVDFITTNISRRKNHKKQSLLPKRRDDYKLDFGLIKTVPLSSKDIVLEVKQTFNKSSVDIFSYRETVFNFSLKL
jgi:hypothetical protein